MSDSTWQAVQLGVWGSSQNKAGQGKDGWPFAASRGPKKGAQWGAVIWTLGSTGRRRTNEEGQRLVRMLPSSPRQV